MWALLPSYIFKLLSFPRGHQQSLWFANRMSIPNSRVFLPGCSVWEGPHPFCSRREILQLQGWRSPQLQKAKGFRFTREKQAATVSHEQRMSQVTLRKSIVMPRFLKPELCALALGGNVSRGPLKELNPGICGTGGQGGAGARGAGARGAEAGARGRPSGQTLR